MNTLEDWLIVLQDLTDGTDYYAIYNGNAGGVSVYRKGTGRPQLATVYPKKTQDAGLVIHPDCYPKLNMLDKLTPYRSSRTTKTHLPHYNQVPDQVILEAFRCVVGKRK